jgi:hypothetical protein
MTFEERYEDVLQNIEFAIVGVYHAHPEMVDFQAQTGLEWALRVYGAEQRGRAAPPEPAGLPGEVGRAVKAMCDWRLGRSRMTAEDGQELAATIEPKTLDEIVACLKRVRRSIEFWTRKGGRQGYLEFVAGFVG